MKNVSVFSFILLIGLLFSIDNRGYGQCANAALCTGFSGFEMIVTNSSGTQVTTLAPSTVYTLTIRIKTSVATWPTCISLWQLELGDGWTWGPSYLTAAPPPTIGFDVGCAPTNSRSCFTRTFSFKTVDASSFGGAFFKVRGRCTTTTGTYTYTNYVSKLFPSI